MAQVQKRMGLALLTRILSSWVLVSSNRARRSSGSTVEKSTTEDALALSIVMRVGRKSAIVMSVHQSDHTLVNAGIMRRVQAGTPIYPTLLHQRG